MPALGAYIHAKNLSFALYTAESDETCGGYPASANHEVIDANTFARWGVDYLCVKPSSAPPRAGRRPAAARIGAAGARAQGAEDAGGRHLR